MARRVLVEAVPPPARGHPPAAEPQAAHPPPPARGDSGGCGASGGAPVQAAIAITTPSARAVFSRFVTLGLLRSNVALRTRFAGQPT